MATPTYTLIDSTTLTSSASSVTFSSISGSYRDLVLVIEITGGNGDFYPRLQYNNDTGSNYSYVEMQGNGSSVNSYYGTSETGIQLNGAYASIGNTAFYTVNIFDYSATDKHKTSLSRSNRANQIVNAMAQRWANTSAISTIKIYSANGNTMASGGKVYLYGIEA